MQSMPDMTVNAKIPDNLVHKLSFERFRIKFQCLERLPFNFKITVFLLWFWWYSRRHFWRLTEGAKIVFILFQYDCSLSSRARRKLPAENYRSENRNYQDAVEIIEIKTTDRQCYQLKNCKFYENFSEYANFSTISGKGHKTKDQFL